jgi:hypothetical protein
MPLIQLIPPTPSLCDIVCREEEKRWAFFERQIAIREILFALHFPLIILILNANLWYFAR